MNYAFIFIICLSIRKAAYSNVKNVCEIDHAELLARNVANVTLRISKGTFLKSNMINCRAFLTNASCESEFSVDDISVSVPFTGEQTQTSTSLWFDHSLIPDNDSTVNICVLTESNSQISNPRGKSLKSNRIILPPIIDKCIVYVAGDLTRWFLLDNHWTYAYVKNGLVDIECTLKYETTLQSITWCKNSDANCNTTYKNTDAIAQQWDTQHVDNGTYYAYITNDFGSAMTHLFPFELAYYNRDVSSRDVHLNEGDFVVIKCLVQDCFPRVNVFDIEWWFFIDFNKAPDVVELDERTFTNLDGNLVIFDLKKEDALLYSCGIRDELNSDERYDSYTTLHVTPNNGTPLPDIPLVLITDGFKDEILAIVDEKAKLQCIFNGRPKPQIKWTRNGEVIRPNAKYLLVNYNMTLMVGSITYADGGMYKCEASNGKGQVLSSTILLRIEERASIVSLMSQNAIYGDDVTFHCHYRGNDVSLEWYVNNSLVVNGKVPDIRIENKDKLMMTSVKDPCLVRCSVYNVHGLDHQYAYLTVMTEKTVILSLDYQPRKRLQQHVKQEESEHNDEHNIKPQYESYNNKSIIPTTLTCNARTDQRTAMEILWLFNGEEINLIKNNSNVNRVSYNGCEFSSHQHQQHILTFDCSRIAGEVNITCVATNRATTYFASLIFYPDVPIIMIQSSKAKAAYLFDEWWKLVLVLTGAALLLILSLSLSMYGMRRCISRHKKSHTLLQVDSQINTSSNADDNGSLLSTAAYPMTSRPLKKDLINVISTLLIPRTSLELKKCIGNGHFGRVYLATLMHGQQIVEVVAVKTMKYKAEESEMVELFLKEAVLMKDFHHPHVLGIKGITFADDSTPMVILPFMANGDLRNYILNPELNITILSLLMMGIQVAHGMAYLSSHHFVHRDLAARNCMVNDTGVVKIADFGMSRQLLSCDYYRVEQGKDPFPVRWMAPECLEAKIFTTKSDVWAYGVLLWELMTRGAVPYAEAENWQVAGLIQNGVLLEKPPFCPDVVYVIMCKCWTQDAQMRPTFDQLINDVNSVVNLVCPEATHHGTMYTNLNRRE